MGRIKMKDRELTESEKTTRIHKACRDFNVISDAAKLMEGFDFFDLKKYKEIKRMDLIKLCAGLHSDKKYKVNIKYMNQILNGDRRVYEIDDLD